MANDSINLNIEMGGNAKQYLEVVSEETFELANTYVGKSIKNARSQSQQIEGKVLNIGRGKMYFRGNGAPAQQNAKWGGMHVTESYWDSQSKSYRTLNALMARKKRQKVRKNGDKHLRLQNFTFKKAAGSKRGMISNRAEAGLTSNLANLHERDVYFPKGSINFFYGLVYKGRRFQKGGKRKGKHYFDKYRTAALSLLPKSETEALSAWDEAIKKRTEKI